MSDTIRTDAVFRNVLDGLRPATLSALMDLADGMWIAVFEWPWLMDALERRGLVIFDIETAPGPKLTDLGAAFVQWYRSRDMDLPVQQRLL